MPIRVVIAEDNALLRDGLARLISSTDGFELVGHARPTTTSCSALVETTDSRRRRHRHPHAADRHRRGHPRRRGAAHQRIPTSAWSCSASTCRRRTRWRCWRRAPSGVATC